MPTLEGGRANALHFDDDTWRRSEQEGSHTCACARLQGGGFSLAGYTPQSMYGVQQFGLSPTAVRTLRRQAAWACSTLGHGRCLTSLLALEMGGSMTQRKRSSGTFSSTGSTCGSIARQRSAKGYAVLGTWRGLALLWQRGGSAGTEPRAPCQLPLRRCTSSSGIRRDQCSGLRWMVLSFLSWLMVRWRIPDSCAVSSPAAIDQQLWTRAAQHEQGKGLAARRRLARHQIAPRTSQEARPTQGGTCSHGLSHREIPLDPTCLRCEEGCAETFLHRLWLCAGNLFDPNEAAQQAHQR